MTGERLKIEGYAPESVIAALSGSAAGDVTPEEAAEVARGLNAVVAAEIAGGIRGGRVGLAAELLAEARRKRAELEAVPVPYTAAIVERGDGSREKALLARVPTDGLDIDGLAAAIVPEGDAPSEVERAGEVLKVADVVGQGVLPARIADPAVYIAAAPPEAAMPEGMYLRALEDLCESMGWDVERRSRGSYLIDPRDVIGAKVPIDVSHLIEDPAIADPATWIEAAREGVEAALSAAAVEDGDPNLAMARRARAEALSRELPSMVGEVMSQARWHSFGPSMVPVQEAAWALSLGDGRQAVAECHLTDDEESPWGFGFYFAGFTYEPEDRRWVERDGGLFWGHVRADEPELALEAICSCGPALDLDRVVQIDYDLLEGIGLWSHEGRALTPDEMGAPPRALPPSMAPAETGREGVCRGVDGTHPDGCAALVDSAESRPQDGRRTRP